VRNINLLIDKYGSGIEGVGRAIADRMSHSMSRQEQADLLCYIGMVSEYLVPELSENQEGFPFYRAAIQICPDHFEASYRALLSFQLPFNGHRDIALARQCLKTVEDVRYDQVPEYHILRAPLYEVMKGNNVDINALRNA
jgi:hypothetical protein